MLCSRPRLVEAPTNDTFHPSLSVQSGQKVFWSISDSRVPGGMEEPFGSPESTFVLLARKEFFWEDLSA
jgi:hypothetical protein